MQSFGLYRANILTGTKSGPVPYTKPSSFARLLIGRDALGPYFLQCLFHHDESILPIYDGFMVTRFASYEEVCGY
jgi:hypothetical protein